MILFDTKIVFVVFGGNSSLYVLALNLSHFQLEPSHILFCTQV